MQHSTDMAITLQECQSHKAYASDNDLIQCLLSCIQYAKCVLNSGLEDSRSNFLFKIHGI